MTKNQLEAALLKAQTDLTEAQATIEAQAAALSEVPSLREQHLEMSQHIVVLEVKLAEMQNPDKWDDLIDGWMKSSLGRRTMSNPKIDTSGFDMGVHRQNFKLIRTNYHNILAAWIQEGHPATAQEQQEIGLLLQRLGFA